MPAFDTYNNYYVFDYYMLLNKDKLTLILLFSLIFSIFCTNMFFNNGVKEHFDFYKTDMDLKYDGSTPDQPSGANMKSNNYSVDVPHKRIMNEQCDENDNLCIRNRIADKYGITGGQGMYVNIDGNLLYNPKKFKKRWSKIGCGTFNKFSAFNCPENTLHNKKIEFSENVENNKRVFNSFRLGCHDTKINEIKNKLHQEETDFNINNIDYKTAEQYYKQNYGYNIAPLNTELWWVPANYTKYSEYNRPSLDKIFKDNIPQKDKYRTRAMNWQFGKPI